MSKKKLRDIAIVILVIFAITIVVYPLIFGPEQAKDGEAPVELEMQQ